MAEWPYSTAQWQRLRLKQLQLHPLCEACLKIGMVKVANHVDHRIAISQGGEPFPRPGSGLCSFCRPCHSAKTARSPEAGAIKTSKPRKGCDASGMPLDPDHPWNKAGGALENPKRATPRTDAPHSDSISFRRRRPRG